MINRINCLHVTRLDRAVIFRFSQHSDAFVGPISTRSCLMQLNTEGTESAEEILGTMLLPSG